jgi:hypothetical protein
MPTAKGGYYLADGTRVPSVTTIIGACHLGSIDGLLGWANKLGREGKSHTEERDKAANAGTACHAMAECYAKGIEFDRSPYPAEILAKADGAFSAFREWAQQTRLRIVETECPLVSERYRFGGTLDAMLVNDRLALGDWKTSNGLRVGMLCQLAAYGKLWEEIHPDRPIEGGYHLMRFSRPDHPDDPVHFAHHYWSDVDLGWQAFLRMRELYDLHYRLRKLAA